MVFVFGECELDLARGELRRRGEVRHVEPQVFALLAYLIEHRDRLVSPAELLDHVWERRFVTPATLNSRVKTARQAIGDDGREQHLIRTLRGRGFRFVAPVEVRDGAPVVSRDAAETRTPETVSPPPTADATSFRRATTGGGATLERARAAFARGAWREAYDELIALDSESTLDAGDLERLGEAAWWLIDSATSVRARERAYREFVRRDDQPSAGRVALVLAEDHFHRLAPSVAQGWFRRAERHLGGRGDVLEVGWLHRMRSVMALGERRFDDALADADRALDIARRIGNADLDALALQDRGRILVALGRVAEGMALVDEAMAAVAGGGITPHTTGRTYCNMIGVCERLSDYGRAAEWHDVAQRWAEPYADSGFPGICRVFRAGILRLRGALAEAEREARRACEELEDFLADIAGEGFYELGEIRLRAGDLRAADAMFAAAHTRGREPQPGLALLRLAEGNLDAARSMIERALAEPALAPLDRSKLLPAFVEIVLACGALDAAAQAVTELDTITETYTSSALLASASLARGALELARGEPSVAELHLRRARRRWMELEMPYELSTTRLLLARAYTALGHRDEAELEAKVARATLERIGATSRA
jgi:DNA-binding winged helix-turn-helix (wHTH) protein/tetratricopeptide (TPR) repeat protein